MDVRDSAVDIKQIYSMYVKNRRREMLILLRHGLCVFIISYD